MVPAGKLEYLDLTGANLNDEGLLALAESARMLESFYPGSARATTDEAWALLARQCPHLKVVLLSAATHLSGAGGWHRDLVQRGVFTGFDYSEGVRPTRRSGRWGGSLTLSCYVERRVKGWVG